MANTDWLNASSQQTYLRLLKSLKRHLPLFFLGILGTILASSLSAAITWGIKPLIDKGFVQQDPTFIRWLPWVIVPLFVMRAVTSFTSQYCMSKVGRNIVTEFRQKIFAKLLQMPSRFYDQTNSAQLLSLINYNTEQLAEGSTFALLTTVQEGALVIGLLVVMFIHSWQLTLLFLLSAPVIALAFRYTSRRLRMLSGDVQTAMAEVTHVAQEGIDGYKVIRTFGAQNYEQEKFDQYTQNARQKELKVVVTNTLGTSMVQLIAAVPISVILYLATSSKIAISAGSFGSIIVAMMTLLRPMRRITRVNTMIQKGVAGAQSIFQLLDQPGETDAGEHQCPRVKGRIELRDVHFHYQDPNRVVLDNITLTIEAGQKVALVGKSGSGKSTLVNCIPRFYDCQSGTILLDGVDIKDYQLANLRAQFSFVSQDICLFNDTIANNIAYGAAEADEAQLRAIATAAHALEFIEALPQGFQTHVGENGVMLSGGQRQRLAIARALFKDAPILILDEATSALDTESERHIQDALESLMEHRTTIIIAHRLSTVENADQIVVLDNGRLMESGTHQELLQKNRHYAKLHRLQYQQHSADQPAYTML